MSVYLTSWSSRIGVFCLALMLLTLLPIASTQADIDWVTGTGTAEPKVHLYFFWSKRCPHCQKALPFVASLDQELDWLALHDYEITASRDNVQRYIDMAGQLGRDARSVPAFFICERMLTGFDDAGGMGSELRELAELCRPASVPAVAESEPDSGVDPSETPRDTIAALGAAPTNDSKAAAKGATQTASVVTVTSAAEKGARARETLRVPVLGELDAESISLPLFTLLIAGLDAFNPCAFFVLLFLLSLMVHARSRGRMLLVGGTFVFFSGLVYFLFMAAWLNLFLVIGGAPIVTVAAGLLALLIGALNVKDFFLFKQGPTLSIPEQAKPGLFRRMRGLLSADSLATMLFGTVTLALAANSYELLCTAGFPMVYTRVLTLNALSDWGYYGWLLIYNLIYILPLLAIVLVFTFTLGARKLTERQGRVLKLLAGSMMLGLGLVMLLAPELLNSPVIGVGLLMLAVLVTVLATWLTRGQHRPPLERAGA
jgi:glutaredoxin-related protein